MLCDDDALVVVESAGHRLVRLPLPARLRRAGPREGSRRAVAEVAGGPVRLRVRFTPPAGMHLDRRFGEPTSLSVDAAAGVLDDGAGTSPGLERTLLVRGPGVLRVEAVAAACDRPADEVGIFAACHRYRQEWEVDVRLVAGSPAGLVLDWLRSA